MRKTLLLAALIALTAPPAQAQLLMDQVGGMTLRPAGPVGPATNPHQSTIVNTLKKQGYTNIAPVKNNPTQYTASTPNGMAVIINVVPLTGQILSILPR